MTSLSFTLNLDPNDYPYIDIDSKNIERIFNTGYHIHYPKYQSIEYTQMLSKINELKQDINNINITEYIVSLESSLNKLIGISNNSSKKGNLAENILETIFSTRYGDLKFERKSTTPHCGDAWIYLPNNTVIMIDSKNYTTTVKYDEITKLEQDMIGNHIKWGMMISFNAQIQGMKELDYHIFTHNNETYSIIMISNLSANITILDLALQILRKLIIQFDTKINFPWIVHDINSSLIELDEIIKKNYSLRDQYYSMEKDIQKSLSIFHTKLRDYQYEIELKINHIISKIHNTLEESAKIKGNDNTDLLKQYQDKKILPLIIRLIDIIHNKNWKLCDNNLYHNDDKVGEVKIQLKKIIINIINYDLIINLNIGKDKENIKNLELLKNL